MSNESANVTQIQSYSFTVKRFSQNWFEVARMCNGQDAGKSMVSLEVGESITVSFPAGLGAGGLAMSVQQCSTESGE